MSFLNLRFFSNIMDGVDVVVKLAMALFLICKPKTWELYFGGCISKLLYICLVYHM